MKEYRSVFPAVCALLGAGLISACSRSSSATTAAPVRPVRVAEARSAALDNTLRAVGLLAPKDETRLSFKVGGLVESIPVEEGRPVRAGQVLAVLKPAEINASLEQARQATAKAQRDLARGKALLADGVATEEQVQDLTTAFQVARAAQSSAEFNAAHARIVAAADGVVLRKLALPDEWVPAGQTVVVLGGANRGWVVRVGLADRDAVRIHEGDAARVEFDAWPGRVWSGRVSNIASAADPATGTFSVEIQVSAGGARFAQGLVAKVALSPQTPVAGMVIPVQALLEANDTEAGVFVLDPHNRVVHRVNIHIGRMSGGNVEVLDGLAAGAQVVTEGAAFLENGETVRVAGAPADSAAVDAVPPDGAAVDARTALK
jgi:RND family efflux transporter MFP subunit